MTQPSILLEIDQGVALLTLNRPDNLNSFNVEMHERMRDAILERDRDLAGDINPMLARHGESSEARQYSGRAVDKGWECPFRDPRLEEK